MLIICHKWTIRATVDATWTPCFAQLSSEDMQGDLNPALIHCRSAGLNDQWEALRCDWWINLSVWLNFLTSDTLYVCVCACLSPLVDFKERKTETKLFFAMLTQSSLRNFKMQCPPSNCFLNCTVSQPKHGSGISITNPSVGKQLGCVHARVCVVLISWCWGGGGAENHLST